MTPEELADRLEAAADRVGPALYLAVRHAAELGRAQIRGNASGRPGPNVITGDYRNSWQVDSLPIPHGGMATIGTDRPQGRRLEFGFYDMTDSLGRHYLQPPFPHVQPALPGIAAALHFAVRSAVEEILR